MALDAQRYDLMGAISEAADDEEKAAFLPSLEEAARDAYFVDTQPCPAPPGSEVSPEDYQPPQEPAVPPELSTKDVSTKSVSSSGPFAVASNDTEPYNEPCIEVVKGTFICYEARNQAGSARCRAEPAKRMGKHLFVGAASLSLD